MFLHGLNIRKRLFTFRAFVEAGAELYRASVLAPILYGPFYISHPVATICEGLLVEILLIRRSCVLSMIHMKMYPMIDNCHNYHLCGDVMSI